MSRYGKVGVFRQIAHPRIRGGLDPSHEQKHHGRVLRLADYKTDEETYFVPSFSIRRHLHRSEEAVWDTERRLLQRRLGRDFTTTPSKDVTLKVVEQHRFIKNARAAGLHPEPEQIRDLAYSIRDNLTNLLFNARSPLEVPLGNLGRFGYKENALAYEIAGWRGDRAQSAPNDEEMYMDPMAVLLAERRLAVGAIALAFEGKGLEVDGIAPSPHLTVARYKESIANYRMREIRSKLGDLTLDNVKLGDPIVEMKLAPDMPSISLPVKHAWESLAPLPESYEAPEAVFESAYDRYDAFADLTQYA